MAGRLQGKVAVVTGAAAGIGEATAELFAEEGARVALLDVDATGEAVAQRIRAHGRSALFALADISAEADVAAAIALAAETFGRIDILVNNAAVFVLKGLDATPEFIPPGFEDAMKTTGRALLLIALHQMVHYGQLADARRAAGLPPLM